MAEHPWQPTDPELEATLLDLGTALAYPPTPDLAAAARARLDTRQPVGRRPNAPQARPLRLPVLSMHRPWRRVAIALLAAIVLAVAILALSSAVRASLGSWLRLRGVVIIFAPAEPAPTPPPAGAPLQLGKRLTRAEAQRQVAYRILTPHLADLGAPDEVYLGVPPAGGQVSLVYRARPGLPRAPGTGVGLLLTEFRATLAPFFFKKLGYTGTRIEEVSVNGMPAYWVSGQPHLFGYTDASGQFTVERLRLAGNTLLWQEGDITLRLEGVLSKQAALRIAGAVR